MQVSRGSQDSRGFGTTPVIQHLNRHHIQEYKKYEEEQHLAKTAADEKRKRTAAAGPGSLAIATKQPRLQQCIERSKMLARDNPRSMEITRLIGNMMALDNQPFSVVEDVGFKRVIRYLEPRFQIPSRTYFSRTYIPDLYKRMTHKLQEKVNAANFISFTSDGWTSTNNLDGFLSLSSEIVVPCVTQGTTISPETKMGYFVGSIS